MALIESVEKSILKIVPVIETGDKSKRDREIFIRYFALDGGERPSMRDVGEPYELTRESVRQTIDRMITEIRALGLVPPSVQKAVNHVVSAAPGSAERISAELHEMGLLDKTGSVRTVLDAAKIFKLDVKDIQANKYQSSEFVCTREQAKMLKPIVSQAIKEASHNGATQASQLVDAACVEVMIEQAIKAKKGKPVEDLKESLRQCQKLSRQAKTQFARDLLDLEAETTWLLDDWAYFGERGRNRLLTRLYGVFSIMERVAVHELIEGLERYWSKGKRVRDKDRLEHGPNSEVPPVEVVEAIVNDLDGFQIDEDGVITCDLPLDPKERLKPYEMKVVTWMESRPSPGIREKEMESALVHDKKGKYSFSMVLNHSPLIKRMTRGTYSLIGKPNPKALRELQDAPHQKSA